MRSIREDVVVLGLFTRDDFVNFLSDRNEGFDESTRYHVSYCHICNITKKNETYRSISSLDSDSVGSINQQVEMGHWAVGGWKL